MRTIIRHGPLELDMDLTPAFTFATLRDIALALPAVYADPEPNPAFRVRNRFLARLHDTLAAVVVRAPLQYRESLFSRDPITFFVTPQYVTAERVLVRLATATVEDLAEVVEAAWRTEAPQGLVRKYCAKNSSSAPDEQTR